MFWGRLISCERVRNVKNGEVEEVMFWQFSEARSTSIRSISRTGAARDGVYPDRLQRIRGQHHASHAASVNGCNHDTSRSIFRGCSCQHKEFALLDARKSTLGYQNVILHPPIFSFAYSGGWSPNWVHPAPRPFTVLLCLPRVIVRMENYSVEW
jgi:hypothetical protein